MPNGLPLRRHHGRKPVNHRLRRLLLESLEDRRLLASDWQNEFTSRDVNGDKVVSPLDVLIGVNELNERRIIPATSGALPDRSGHMDAPLYDVNGDGFLSPADPLIVINALNDDVQAPQVSVGLQFDSAPGGTNDDRITFSGAITGTAIDNLTGIKRVEYSLNGGAFESVEFGRDGSFSIQPTLAEGEHTVVVRATDGRNFTAGSEAFQFTLDAAAPEIVLPNPGPFVTRGNVTITGQVSDALAGVESLLAQIDLADTVEVNVAADGTFSFMATLPTDASADGQHLVRFRATDKAGNLSGLASVNWKLDTRPPALSTTVEGLLRNRFSTFDLDFGEPMSADAFDVASYNLLVTSGADTGQMISLRSVEQVDGTARITLPELLPNAGYRLSLGAGVTDLAGNRATPEQIEFTIEQPTRVAELSPAAGEELVSVTRETIIRFDNAVDPATITDESFYLIANSERVPGRIRVSSTERFATFFYDDPLPASTAVRVMVDGNRIMGRDGLPLDADNDGEPGGVKQADFRTLPLTLIPGTQVWGYIYDSYNKAPAEHLPIEVPVGDPQFDPAATGTQTIPFTRAEFFPGTGTGVADPRLHPNKISSFIDASMVYGSDDSVARSLRRIDGSGKLKTSQGELLPINDAATFPGGTLPNDNNGPFAADELFVAGDVRAVENPLLSSLHTLFVREHNRKADEIKTAHSNWSDEEIYQEARRWVGALIQHITYQEFLPTMVGPSPLPAYGGYQADVDPGISSLFSAAAFRVGHTLQTSEITRLDASGASLPGGALTLRDVFFNPNPIKDDGIDPYLRGLIATPAQNVDLFVLDDLRNFLFGPPGAGGLDLAAINIQRGRDMGLPSYNQARRDLGLQPVNSFDEITSNATVASALQAVYGDVESIDLWVGGLAEDYVPGGTVGTTFAAIIVDQFQRSRDSDRFWYENSQFATDELAELRSTTLSDVLMRNTDLANVPANVFTSGTMNAGPAAGGMAGLPSDIRSYDGYGNIATSPRLGRAGEPLLVNHTVGYGDGISTPAGADRPNPRSISNALLAQPNMMPSSMGLTQMFVTWGQFLDHDMSLTPSQSADGTDIPVINATITLDALPNISATTDKFGYFALTSPEGLPAPDFFVHIDGSTALNAPTGTAYATLGKPFHSVPGQSTQLNMAGTPFAIYLPPMSMSDIVELDPNSDTDVGFGPAAQEQIRRMFANDPDTAQLVIDTMRVTYPAGSAQDANGVPATRATIIPVDPERLPAPLPPGVNPGLVVSVQAGTDAGFNLSGGSTNFDAPAPATFPNLENRPLGEQVEVFSFDHDAGMWKPIGLATIQDIGSGMTAAVSNPGVGILAPGWHFVDRGQNWTHGGNPGCSTNCVREGEPRVEALLLTPKDSDSDSFTFRGPSTPRRSEHLPPEDAYLQYTVSASPGFELLYEITGTRSGTLRDGASENVQLKLRSEEDIKRALTGGSAYDHDFLAGGTATVQTKRLQNGRTTLQTMHLVRYVYVDASDDEIDSELKFRDALAGSAQSSRLVKLIGLGDDNVQRDNGQDFSWAWAGPWASWIFHPGSTNSAIGSDFWIEGEIDGIEFETNHFKLKGEGTERTTIALNEAKFLQAALELTNSLDPGVPNPIPNPIAAFDQIYAEVLRQSAQLPTLGVVRGTSTSGNTIAVDWINGLHPRNAAAVGAAPCDILTEVVLLLDDELASSPRSRGFASAAYLFDESLNIEPSQTVSIFLSPNLVGFPDVPEVLGVAVAHEAVHTLGFLHSDGLGLGHSELMYGAASTPKSAATITQQVAAVGLDAQSSSLASLIAPVAQTIRTELSVDPTFRCQTTDHLADAALLHIFDENDEVAFNVELVSVLGLQPNHPVSRNIRLRNGGTAPIRVASVNFSNDTGSLTVNGTGSGESVIAVGEELTLEVAFSPVDVGLVTDQLIIQTNAVNGNTSHPGTFSIPVRAVAIPERPSMVLLSPESNLGGVLVGNSLTAFEFITVSNEGAQDLMVTTSIIVGAEDFELGTVNAPADNIHVLQQGETVTVPIVFRPSASGLRHGVIEVQTNDANRPAMQIVVVGTGMTRNAIINSGLDWGLDYMRLVSGPLQQRFQSNAAGDFSVALPTDSEYTVQVFDPVSGLVAFSTGTTGPAGGSTDVTSPLIFRPSTAPDSDGDGLPDDIELIIGTDPNRVDTSGNGISDFQMVKTGLNPLEGLSFPTGMIGSVSPLGEVRDVAFGATANGATSGLAYLATGSHGMAIVDTSRFDQPVVLGQLDLNGDSQDVAVDAISSVAIVAAGEGGLHFVDVIDPMMPRRVRTASVNATQVEMLDGVAYAAAGSRIQGYDPVSGDLLSTLIVPTSGKITGLTHEGTFLYAMDEDLKVHVLEVSRFRVEKHGDVVLPQGGGKMSVNNDVVYIGAQPSQLIGGFVTVDVEDPMNPTVISGSDLVDPFIAPGQAIVPNGSGLGLAVGRVGRTASQPVVSIVDLSDPEVTDNYLTQFNLSAIPESVTIASGIGYVAIGTGGVVVVNYVPFDNRGLPPTVTATGPVGTTVQEGSLVSIRTSVTDDVQVRDVELLMDGVVVARDVSAPWDLRVVTPALASGMTNVMFQVRATDTGGNVGLSELLTYALTPDIRPPEIIGSSPSDDGAGFRVSAVTLRFDEPIDTTRLSISGFTLTNLGANFRLGGGDDTTVTLDRVEALSPQRVVVYTQEPLPEGRYRLTGNASAIADVAGNQVAMPVGITFTSFDLDEQNSVAWISDFDGEWDEPGNWSTGEVPGPNDAVIIDRKTANPRIHLSSGDVRIRSLVAREQFIMDGGSLTVTEASEIQSRFEIGHSSTLTVDGRNALFTANGDTKLTGGSLIALNGGIINLPRAASVTRTDGSGVVTLLASGGGSVLDLRNVSSIDLGPEHAVTLRVEALSGGRIDLRNVVQIADTAGSAARQADLLSDGVGSVIDLSLLSNFTQNSLWNEAWRSSMTARSGGTIHAPNLNTLRRVDITLNGTGVLPVAGWQHWNDGIATLSGATYAFNSLVSADETQFNAIGGGINLPLLTSLVGGQISLSGGATAAVPVLSNIDGASLLVSGGVTLAVPQATAYSRPEDNGTVTLRASGAGSVLDLRNITDIDMGSAHAVSLKIEALSGGRVDLRDVIQISDMAGSAARQSDLVADGAGSIIDLPALSNFTQNSLWSNDWRSSMTARSGGTINAPNLSTLRRVDVTLNGTGTLPVGNWQHWNDGIATLSGPSYAFNSLVNADETQFNATGGSVGLPVLTSLMGGQISLSGGAIAAVPVLSNIDGASLLVSGGVTLAVPQATAYSRPEDNGTVTLRASGAGSVLDLRNISDIDIGSAHAVSVKIEAISGGRVDLRNVIQISDMAGSAARQADLLVDGVGSVIDLSLLTNFTQNSLWSEDWRSSMTARTGGTINAPNLSVLRRVDVTLNGTGTLPVGSWQHWNDGIATLSVASYAFNSLVNADETQFNATSGSLGLPLLTSLMGGQISLSGGATATVPVLSNIDGASLLVSGGVTLAVPQATSYSRPKGNGTVTLRAGGSNSVLDLRNITDIDMGPAHAVSLNIEALSGGRVDLRNVIQISDIAGSAARQADLLAEGVGSVIDLSALTNFTHNSAWTSDWESSIRAANLGIVNLHPIQTLLVGVTTSTSNDGMILGQFGLRVANSYAEELASNELPDPLTNESLAPWLRIASDSRRSLSGNDLWQRVSHIDIRVRDLPDAYLGYTSETALWIDLDAAGHGWFVDPTPFSDEEFDEFGRAIAGGPADGRVDLLTVVMHELGHVLGQGHDDDPDSLMYDLLAAGRRKRVAAADVEALFANREWQ